MDAMNHKVVFTGLGGQGVLRMGRLLALAAMNQGKRVTCLPSRDYEVSGAAFDCTVALSDREIASPVASSPDAAVIMAEPGLAHLGNLVRPGGVVLVNRSTVRGTLRRDDVTLVEVKAEDLARDLGEVRVADLVMLGALAQAGGLVPLEALVEALEEKSPGAGGDSLNINRRALEQGALAARRV